MRFHIVDKSGNFKVSTALILDREENPYETALMVGNWFGGIKVFEIYPTEEEARIGHLKWIEKAKDMTMDAFDKHKDLVDDYMLTDEQIIEWTDKSNKM